MEEVAETKPMLSAQPRGTLEMAEEGFRKLARV
jgi:hypothetical protein